jgi:hypothetical protein
MSKTKTAAYNTVFGLFKGDLKAEYIPKILAMAAIYCDILDIPDIDESKSQVVETKKRGPKKGWKKENPGLAKNGFAVSKYKDETVVQKFDELMARENCFYKIGDPAKLVVKKIADEAKIMPLLVARILNYAGRSKKGPKNQLQVYHPQHAPIKKEFENV